MRHRLFGTAALCTALTLSAAGVARAADDQPPASVQAPLPPAEAKTADPSPEVEAQNPQSSYIFGDLFGYRSMMKKTGVDLSLSFVGEGAYNPQGGTTSRGDFADQISFGALFDLQKLAGVPDAQVKLVISDRNGSNLAQKANLGVLQEVQEIYGRGNVARITELSYDQLFFDKRLDLKFGRLDIGDDFVSFSCKFQNLSFCYFIPDHIVGNNFFAYPVSQWAARAKFRLAEDWTFKVGVYDINTKLAKPGGGFLIAPSGSIGSDTLFELDWTPKLGPRSLPGIYKAGLWYDSAKRDDVLRDVNNQVQLITGAPPLQRRGSIGYWAQAQQQVTGTAIDSPGSLSLFFNYLKVDDRVVRVDQLLTVGLFYTGLLPVRPHDDIGVAVGRSHVSNQVATAEDLFNATSPLTPLPVQGSEYPTEIYYSINITPAFTVRPNFQYIVHPGGTSANKDAAILGAKTVLSF